MLNHDRATEIEWLTSALISPKLGETTSNSTCCERPSPKNPLQSQNQVLTSVVSNNHEITIQWPSNNHQTIIHQIIFNFHLLNRRCRHQPSPWDPEHSGGTPVIMRSWWDMRDMQLLIAESPTSADLPILQSWLVILIITKQYTVYTNKWISE